MTVGGKGSQARSVVVCPVDCFYEGQQMLFIHPDECVDCGAYVPECPVEAICHEDNVPEPWRDYIPLNREMSARCPNINENEDAVARRRGLEQSPRLSLN
ncbi:MAG TPA: ferredoxin family protein [Planctomycetaceae bacterium]|nr:ferredoxin family protein [Planctomycetaceae bacterium]